MAESEIQSNENYESTIALEDVAKDTSSKSEGTLLYNIEDNPPWHLSLLLGFQHYLTMVGSTIALPLVLAPSLCIGRDDPVLGILVSTILFVSGLITFLQVSIGVRLPIVQGGTFAFLIPTLAILNSYGKCADATGLSESDKEAIWITRVREIQGAIMTAALFQVAVGATGLIGFVLKWITPLTIIPTITLLGIALSKPASQKSSGCWPIALLTAAILMIFSQYLADTKIGVPVYKKKQGIVFKKFAIFSLFPILLGVGISWGIAGILTVTDVLPANSTARTDLRNNIISEAPWLYVPYPFQFGLPTVSISSTIGILAAVIASIIESVGDYYACARICGVSSPPVHAINRGITIEGIGCILAGMWGTCNGTTSYSSNIGAIRITGVASRRVLLVGSFLMLAFGIFGKFGAICATIPDPILGGVFIILFSMITSIGLSNLQLIDLNSPRNLFVIGTSIFIGLMIPLWLDENVDSINTGSISVDRMLLSLLTSPMLVGGVLGMLLDNLIPGTPEERGIHLWNEKDNEDEKIAKRNNIYDLPIGMEFIRRHAIFEKIPLSPTFGMSRSKK